MRSKCSFILKASTALVLALLMLFGTVATSVAAVVENADTGAQADLAETGASQVLVFFGICEDMQNWKGDGYPKLNVWGGTSSGGVTDATATGGTYIDNSRTYTMYYANVNNDHTNVQAKLSDNWYSGTVTSADLTKNNAYFFCNAASGWDGQWGQTYQLTSTASLSATSTSITTAGTSTLTPSLSSNETYNEIKSTTYLVTDNPGSAGSVTDAGVFSATAAGTYTVTATVTYNAKGFSDITKTATATKNITVTAVPSITSVTSSSSSLKIGETATITTVLANTSSPTVTYTSSDSTVLSVSKNSDTSATIKALKPGSATIEASLSDSGTTHAVSTSSISVATPTVSFGSTTDVNLNVNATNTNAATGSTIGTVTSDTITYSSSAPAVASVNASTGEVTAKTSGSAVISATRTIVCGEKETVVNTTTNYTVNVAAPSVTFNDFLLAKGDGKSLSGLATSSTPAGLPISYSITGEDYGCTIEDGVLIIPSSCAGSSISVKASATNASGTEVAYHTATVTILDPGFSIDDTAQDSVKYLTIGSNYVKELTSNYDGTYAALSSDTGVATVSESSGTLTVVPRAKGEALITVTLTKAAAPGVSSSLRMSALKRIKYEIAMTSSGALTTSVSFTVKVAEADAYKYLYFTDGVGWSGVKAYFWKNSDDRVNSGWNSEFGNMVKIGTNNEDKDVYAIRYDADAGYDRVIIRDANNENNKVQIGDTSDLPLGTHNAVWCNTANTNNTTTAANWWDCTISKPQIVVNSIADLPLDETATLTATVVNDTTPSKFTWASSDTDLVTVANEDTGTTNTNTVTGVEVGIPTVTVRAYAEMPVSFHTFDYDSDAAAAYLAGEAVANITTSAENKTITYSPEYSNDGSAFTGGVTGGTITVTNNNNGDANVSSGDNLAHGTSLKIVADANPGYMVKRICWSIDNGETWNNAGGTATYYANSGLVDVLTIDDFKLRKNFKVMAEFVKTYEINFFKSYEHNSSSGQDEAMYGLPGSVRVAKSDGSDSVTYFFDSTVTAGTSNYANCHDDESTHYLKYNEGNIITVPAGYHAYVVYSSLASSAKIESYTYNETAYAVDTSNLSVGTRQSLINAGAVIDQVDHVVDMMGTGGITSDYKNITLTIESKKRIFINFSAGKSNTTGMKVTGLNSGGYYFAGEEVEDIKIALATSSTCTYQFEELASGVTFNGAADGSGTDYSSEFSIVAYDSGDDEETTTADDITYYTLESAAGQSMPDSDVYITIPVNPYYTIALDSHILWDEFEGIYNTATIADINALDASDNSELAKLSSGSGTSFTVRGGTRVKFTMSFKDTAVLNYDNNSKHSEKDIDYPGSYYSLLGWYSGTYASVGEIKNSSATYTVTPDANMSLVACGIRKLYVNGNEAFMGSEIGGWVEDNTEMNYDPELNAFYYESALTADNYNTGQYKVYNGSDLSYSATDVWQGTYLYCNNSSSGDYFGVNYGKSENDGDGWISENSLATGYGAPFTLWYYPGSYHRGDNTYNYGYMAIKTAYQYTNLYVSSGFSGVDTASDTATSEITLDKVAPLNDDYEIAPGSFSITKEGDGWAPKSVTDNGVTTHYEGQVNHIQVRKKDAKVRIFKTVESGYNVPAFDIYDISEKTASSLTAVKLTDTSSEYYVADKNTYYVDVDTSTGDMYICPIIEDDNADMTVSFDATQLDTVQWGGMVSCYAWYGGSGGTAYAAYPGQLMIPSEDKKTWTAHFKATNSSNDELVGITFANYYEGDKTWFGRTSVTVPGSSGTTWTEGGVSKECIVGRYCTPGYGLTGDAAGYVRYNMKVQTYDYREPIAMYDNIEKSDGTNINLTFAIKSGNSTKIASSKHTELIFDSSNEGTGEASNLFDGFWHIGSGVSDPYERRSISKASFEPLTDRTGTYYTDLNGENLSDYPEPSFYIVAKGMVTYNSSSMVRAFYSANRYESAGTDYDAVTYDMSDVNLNYAVQWYVYDANGNYLTNILSAAFADRVADSSLIANKLTSLGYYPDGKAVAMAYENPRLCYNTVNDIANSGSVDDAYRFTGQWYETVDTEEVTVNVKVGYISNGQIETADSNDASYGAAMTKYDVTKGKALTNARYEAVLDPPLDEGVGVASAATTTALGDANNRSVELYVTRGADEFVGWYYRDEADGNKLKPASYTESSGYYPNYDTSKTFYAIFKVTASYVFKYQSRDGEWVSYTVKHELNQDEMDGYSGNHNTPGVPTFLWTAEASAKYATNPLQKAYDEIDGKVSSYKKDISWPNMAQTSYSAVGGIVADEETKTATITATCTTSVYHFTYTINPNSSSHTYAHQATFSSTVPYNKVVTFNPVYSGSESYQYINYTVPKTTADGAFSYWSADEEGEQILSTTLNFGMLLTNGNEDSNSDGVKDTLHVYAQYGKDRPVNAWNPMVEEAVLTRNISDSADSLNVDYMTNYVNIDDERIWNLIKSGEYENMKYGLIVMKAADTTNQVGMETALDKMVRNNKYTAYIGNTDHIAFRFEYGDRDHISNFNRTLYTLTSSYAGMEGKQLTAMAYFTLDGSTYFYSTINTDISVAAP